MYTATSLYAECSLHSAALVLTLRSYPAQVRCGGPVLNSGMFKAPASRPVAGTFYGLVTAYVSFVRLRIHHIKTDSHRIGFDVSAVLQRFPPPPLNIPRRNLPCVGQGR